MELIASRRTTQLPMSSTLNLLPSAPSLAAAHLGLVRRRFHQSSDHSAL